MREEREGRDFIGVGGGVLILNENNEALLIRRAGNARNEAGVWSKPGGTIDYGERAVDAMKREIKEELNVDIEITGLLPYTDHIIVEDNQHWLALNFIAEIVGGELKNMEPHKCDKIAWFPLDQLPEKVTQTTREPITDYLVGKYIKL